MSIKVIASCVNPTSKNAYSLPQGHTFTGRVGLESGVFLKLYGRIVLLDNSADSWDGDVTIADYRPVDIEITIK